MWTTIKTKISGLSTFTQMILVFVPVFVGLGKLITIHDSNLLAKSKAAQEQTTDKAQLTQVGIKVDTLTNMLDRHVRAQIATSKSVNDKLVEVTGNQVKLKTLVTTEFAKSMTPTQVLEMMNYFDTEKKNYNFNMTLPDTAKSNTQYASKK